MHGGFEDAVAAVSGVEGRAEEGREREEGIVGEGGGQGVTRGGAQQVGEVGEEVDEGAGGLGRGGSACSLEERDAQRLELRASREASVCFMGQVARILRTLENVACLWASLGPARVAGDAVKGPGTAMADEGAKPATTKAVRLRLTGRGATMLTVLLQAALEGWIELVRE